MRNHLPLSANVDYRAFGDDSAMRFDERRIAISFEARMRSGKAANHESTNRPYAAALKAHEASGELSSSPPWIQIIEALLFAGGQPLLVERVCQVVPGITADAVRTMVDHLNRTYRRQNRPYAIHHTDAGFVLKLRARHQRILERIRGPREVRLSKAAIEVLSLVAFRQPVTRSELNELRGQDSGPGLRTLIRLGIVAIQPAAESTAEARYGTTAHFLELFGLDSLADLPQTLELSRI